MTRQVFRLVHDTARVRAMQAVRSAPAGFLVEIKEPTRSSDQNAKFHAICADLERSGLPWAGKPRDADAWKVLLVSGHSIATGQQGEVIPGLESEFVSIRESTASMSKTRGSSLIEYAQEFCARNDIYTETA